MSSIRVLLGVAAEQNLLVAQLDVSTAYHNAELEEGIYMEKPACLEKYLVNIILRESSNENSELLDKAKRMLTDMKKGNKEKVNLSKRALCGLKQEVYEIERHLEALVGSLTIGTTFFLSPIAGILTDCIGVRLTTLLGGLLAFLGLFLSSFLTHEVGALYLTYGVMFGIGASLAYTPSLVILGHYFHRYLGLVNGFVTAGSSVFTIVMPYWIDFLLRNLQLPNTFRCLSLFMAAMMIIARLFKPLPAEKIKAVEKANFKSLLNTDIWKDKRYVIWATVIPLALFGYFVPYVHMVNFVDTRFPGEDGKLLVTCLGLTSGLGRLIFGKIADNPRVDRILLQQMSFVLIGSLTMMMVVTDKFFILVLIALAMGLFDGCFISLLGPIAFDLCGQSGAGQAIGFLLGFCSIPLTIGPPLAGHLFDRYNSYTLPFLLAGVPPIIGGFLLCLVRCTPPKKPLQGESPIFTRKKSYMSADDCMVYG